VPPPLLVVVPPVVLPPLLLVPLPLLVVPPLLVPVEPTPVTEAPEEAFPDEPLEELLPLGVLALDGPAALPPVAVLLLLPPLDVTAPLLSGLPPPGLPVGTPDVGGAGVPTGAVGAEHGEVAATRAFLVDRLPAASKASTAKE
jgi:hypothetical protein